MASKEPILSQPAESDFSPEGAAVKTVRGVQLFEDVEKFVIQRKVEKEETWYSPNSYCVYTNDKSLTKPLLMAKEEEGEQMCLRSLFCCNQRKFDMRLVDEQDETVIWLEHPSNCNWPILCPSCRPGMIVRTSSGRILGYVEHAIRDTCGSWLPPSLYYNVIDAKGKSTLKVEGPACKFECLSTTTFRIFSSKWNSYVGELGHNWQGGCDGFFSCCVTNEEDKTSITFPQELGVVEKALLLGTLVLTHINYYEHV